MSESESFPTPSIRVTPEMTLDILLAEWQQEKAALLQRDRQICLDKARRAIAVWRHSPLECPSIPSLQELKTQLEKLTKGQVESQKEEWANDLNSFVDFLPMISEKRKIPEEKLDMSTPSYSLGPTASKQLLDILVDAVPYVEKAVKYVQELIVVYDERLGFFKSQQAQVPLWLKELEGLANSAKKPAEKINKLIAEAKELRRTDHVIEAKKVLKKALPLREKYAKLDLRFGEIAKNLQAHNAPIPYFPLTIREDKLKELLGRR